MNKRKWTGPTGKLPTSEDDEERTEASHNEPKRVRILDEEDEEAGMAADDDAEYFVDEDEDGGRFFGGGLNEEQKRILQIMNRDGEEPIEEAVRRPHSPRLLKICSQTRASKCSSSRRHLDKTKRCVQNTPMSRSGLLTPKQI